MERRALTKMLLGIAKSSQNNLNHQERSAIREAAEELAICADSERYAVSEVANATLERCKKFAEENKISLGEFVACIAIAIKDDGLPLEEAFRKAARRCQRDNRSGE